ncbi:hypothetical protein RhiJN_20223 [Ceratobasidium sp. AG-Ba]|nr:hypothetical protein RhiJN_20223 [Ceratobasidium sp. AG-Ba]
MPARRGGHHPASRVAFTHTDVDTLRLQCRRLYGQHLLVRANTLLARANTRSSEPTPALRSQHPLSGANTCSPEPTPALLEPTPALLEPTPLPGANTAPRSQHSLAASQHCQPEPTPAASDHNSFLGGIPIFIGYGSNSAAA